MAAPTSSALFPADVLEFAAHTGVLAFLERVQEITQRIFPGHAMDVTVTADPEIADERYLTVWVEVPEWTADQFTAARDRWYSELNQVCPDQRGCFYLAMHGGSYP
jgi:hypothetical protein